PPRPPLLPYTTLFRSSAREALPRPLDIVALSQVRARVRRTYELARFVDAVHGRKPVTLRRGQEEGGVRHPERQEDPLAQERIQGDRKSTRLNSSHVKI